MSYFWIYSNNSITAFASVLNRAGGDVRLTGGRFAFLGAEGLVVCHKNLDCRAAVLGGVPLLASPSGNRISVGGLLHTEQRLLDSRTMVEMSTGQAGLANVVIPGDHNLLVEKEDSLYIAGDSGLRKAFQIDHDGTWRQSRFLNERVFARFVGVSSEAVIATTDGKELYRTPVPETWKARFVVSAGGDYFGVSRYGYTRLDQILHLYGLLDPDEGRRPNLQLFQLFRISDGKLIANYDWDPQGQYVVPGLSPSDKRVARVKSGALEIIELGH